MRAFLLGILFALAAAGGVAAWFWYRAPELLPAELRRDNPNSADYAPKVYRWKDAQGRTQLTDSPPPAGQSYETVRIDPNTNVVPNVLPTERNVRREEGQE